MRAAVEPKPMIVRWPADASWRDALRSAGVPRLLLVEPGAVPPAVEDALEDWAWATTDERDVFARLHCLGVRSRRRFPVGSGEPLIVGPDGVLAVGDARILLPPIEARMMAVLIERAGRLCQRHALETAAWGDRPRGAGALSNRISTLRQRISPLGLSVHTIRGQGYTLSLPSGTRAPSVIRGDGATHA